MASLWHLYVGHSKFVSCTATKEPMRDGIINSSIACDRRASPCSLQLECVWIQNSCRLVDVGEMRTVQQNGLYYKYIYIYIIYYIYIYIIYYIYIYYIYTVYDGDILRMLLSDLCFTKWQNVEYGRYVMSMSCPFWSNSQTHLENRKGHSALVWVNPNFGKGGRIYHSLFGTLPAKK